MTKQKIKKKKIPVKGTIIVFAVIVILGLIFLISSGGKIYKSSASNAEAIASGVKVIEELEAKTPAAQTAAAENPPVPAADLDLSAEEEKIMNLSLDTYDDAQTRKWFAGTVILGDSITMAAAEYGYLDYDVIVAHIGTGLMGSEEIVADAISRNPSVMFICLGSNDISNYLGDPELFISQYKNVIATIRASLPTTPLYLHGILPVQEGVYYEEGFEYREAYNDALKKYCDTEENLHYINADFILERDPGLYDVDGMHPVGTFYPKWLTYLADVSGLSAAAAEN